MQRREFLRSFGVAGTASVLAGCTDDTTAGMRRPTSTTPTRTSVTPGTVPESETTTGSPSTSASTTESATTTEERLRAYADQFENVVDVVADADFDPTGREACDARFRTVADDDTLLVFPAGTYLFESVSLFELRNFGMLGHADAVLKAPPNRNGHWLTVDHGNRLLFENFDIDATARRCRPTLKLGAADGLEVRDVEVVRDDPYADQRPSGEVGNALLATVRSPTGSGVIERFVAKRGGYLGTYNAGKGRVGIFIGRNHEGTIKLVDCRIEEFPNNGVYASRTPGKVHVEGGVFRNNDISQVRLGSEGSHLTNATVEVDADAVRNRNPDATYLKPRGVRVESGNVVTAGVTVRNSEISVKSGNASGIVIGKSGGRFRVVDTLIRIDARSVAGILAKPPTGGTYPPPPEPHGGVVRNVKITGSATAGTAIKLYNRPNTTIAETAVRQPGELQDGYWIQSTGCRIEGGSIVTGRYPVLVPMLLSDTASAPDGTREDSCVVEFRNVRDIRTTISDSAVGRAPRPASRNTSGDRTEESLRGRRSSCVTLGELSDAKYSNETILAVLGVDEDGYRRDVVAEETVKGE